MSQNQTNVQEPQNPHTESSFAPISSANVENFDSTREQSAEPTRRNLLQWLLPGGLFSTVVASCSRGGGFNGSSNNLPANPNSNTTNTSETNTATTTTPTTTTTTTTTVQATASTGPVDVPTIALPATPSTNLFLVANRYSNTGPVPSDLVSVVLTQPIAGQIVGIAQASTVSGVYNVLASRQVTTLEASTTYTDINGKTCNMPLIFDNIKYNGLSGTSLVLFVKSGQLATTDSTPVNTSTISTTTSDIQYQPLPNTDVLSITIPNGQTLPVIPYSAFSATPPHANLFDFMPIVSMVANSYSLTTPSLQRDSTAALMIAPYTAAWAVTTVPTRSNLTSSLGTGTGTNDYVCDSAGRFLNPQSIPLYNMNFLIFYVYDTDAAAAGSPHYHRYFYTF